MPARARLPARGFRLHPALRRRRSGQILALAVVIIILFILVAAVLIDVFQIEEARNWGYRVAQQAALAGTSGGRDWTYFQPTLDPTAETPTPRPDGCVEPGRIRLIEATARSDALDALDREMAARGMVVGSYTAIIEVLPDPDGGTVTGFPPEPVRLGASRGTWITDNPAVGVYLTFPVYTFFMSFVGRDSVNVSVFAAAEASQPEACP